MKKWLMSTVLIFMALVLLFQSVFMVDMTQQALILQFGRYVRTVSEPGLHFKIPFLEQATLYDKRVLSSDIKPGEYLTLD